MGNQKKKKKKNYGPFQFGMITRRVHNGSTSYKVKTNFYAIFGSFEGEENSGEESRGE